MPNCNITQSYIKNNSSANTCDKNSSLSDISGMMTDDFLPQTASVDVCVYFRSGDFLMSEHALYGSEIGSSLQQVSCE